MILNYFTWYRKFGCRMLTQIANANISELRFLELPMDSVYHYIDYDSLTLGPSGSDSLFRNIRRPIPILTVPELAYYEGKPKRMGASPIAALRDYYRKNRKLRLLRDYNVASKDRQTPIVYNYAMLPRMYRYPQNLFSHYYQWKNLFRTVISEIVKITETSERQHFLQIQVPQLIPSVQQLTMGAHEANQTTLKYFKEPNSLFLLELWKWWGENRNDSVFADIPKNKIHLVNLIYQESGQWLVINLGILNSFYYNPDEPKEETEEYVVKSKQHISGLQLGKRYLRLMMSLMELRTLMSKPENAALLPEQGELDDEAQINQPDDGIEVDELDDAEDAPEIPAHSDLEYSEPYKENIADTVSALAPLQSLAEIDELADLSHAEFMAHIEKEDALLDQELQVLNDIAIKHAEKETRVDIATITHQQNIHAPEAGIITQCEKLAADGLMSPKELLKFKKLAMSYQAMKAPDGITPLADFMVIKPEDLALKLDEPMPAATAVLDPTMLNSSLNTFDRKYVDHVLHKDYANAVMSLQNAGVAVTGYKIEKNYDICGGYEDHTLKIQPIVGAPSTLRFKLPIVTPDGVFKSSSVTYRMRKQRVQLPIAKISPNKVALTSYYGKVFVTRARKASEDYGQWLLAKVTAKALDRTDLDIVQAAYANVFDQTLICARAYSSIAKGLKSFLCKGYTFVFDRAEILSTIPANVLKKYEKNHSIVIGTDGVQQHYLLLDTNGNLFSISITDNTTAPLGDIDSYLGLDAYAAPVESITAGIFGKDIPVGIILALELGLEKLLALLKADPIRIPSNEKYKPAINEYLIQFNDETLVLNKHNRLATLILSGFNEFEKQLKLFSVYSFDKRGVYVNLLESTGVGVRYVREIDLANSMFVDPITRDILIELKEPTTYLGLLLKAAEMLLVDAHPDELDPAYMRIKGYERMSGAVYNELVQSLRAHNGSIGKASSPIIMNPYAIWKKISEDPVKIQVGELNPILSLMDSEAVTYGGVGGRSSLSMTKRTRGYHNNDMGTISESTVDSGDTGINVYTSADPSFTSVRGVSKRFDLNKPNVTSLLSTSALLSPGSDKDDEVSVTSISNGREIKFFNCQEVL